jgi:hypothetical protein
LSVEGADDYTQLCVEKVVYLVRGHPGATDGDALRDRLLGAEADRILASAEVRGLAILVHDADAAEAPSPAPAPEGEATHLALVSVWVDCYQRRPALDPGPELAVDEYLVVESLYEDHPTRDWSDGERSPGVVTVATIHRPRALPEPQWLHNWHEVQSPASGRLQPRCRYVRNRVVQPLTPDAPDVDGIVEESWPSARHVADPDLFFNGGGDPARVRANLEEMMANVVACLDLERLRSTTMSEYVVTRV